MRTRLCWVSIISIVLVIGLVPGGFAQDKIKIKLTHILADNHSWSEGARKFAELMSQRTKGRVEVSLFANGVLGDERQIVEGMMMGTGVEMAIISGSKMSQFELSAGLPDMPFLFKNYDHAHRVMDSEVGADLAKRLFDKTKLTTLGYFDQGFRHIVTISKQIKSINDLKGLKIRVPDSPTYFQTFKYLGANPTPIPWTEIYTAVQSGVVEGLEGSPETIYTTRLQEVSKYIALTNHIYSGASFLITDTFFKSLPKDIQDLVISSGKEATTYERQVVVSRDMDNLKKLKDAGMIVNEIDTVPMVKAVQPYVEDFAKKNKLVDAVDKINKMR